MDRSKMTVALLKEELKAHGLATVGKKAVLLARLLEVFSPHLVSRSSRTGTLIPYPCLSLSMRCEEGTERDTFSAPP